MNSIDRHARKQVLLTRIAFERIELSRDVARVEQAVHIPRLLRAALGGGLGQSLFGAATAKNGWIASLLSLLGRYRVATGFFGSLLPLLTGRRGWPRAARLVAIGAAAWLGWRAMKGRDDPA